jgi:hypothetical protein
MMLERFARAIVELLPDGLDGNARLGLGGVAFAVMCSQLTFRPMRLVRRHDAPECSRSLFRGGSVLGLRPS